LYFVNWQKDVEIANRNGQRVVLKRDKKTKGFHEYLLASTYTLVSIALGHPDTPPIVGQSATENEGNNMRDYLEKLGIRTPRLITLSDSLLVEEYIERGDLYRVFLDLDDKGIISSFISDKSRDHDGYPP
jgi:hypothetical protein